MVTAIPAWRNSCSIDLWDYQVPFSEKRDNGYGDENLAWFSYGSCCCQSVASISMNNLHHWKDDISLDAQGIASDAHQKAKEELRQRIMEKTQSYILAKADTLGAQVEVSVEVSNDEMTVPSKVRIIGAVSPYAKQAISQMLTEDLGIDKEAQIWIS